MSVHVERDGALVRLRLDKARANAIDADLVEAMIPHIDELGRCLLYTSPSPRDS